MSAINLFLDTYKRYLIRIKILSEYATLSKESNYSPNQQGLFDTDLC